MRKTKRYSLCSSVNNIYTDIIKKTLDAHTTAKFRTKYTEKPVEERIQAAGKCWMKEGRCSYSLTEREKTNYREPHTLILRHVMMKS